ncbi:MAG: glucose-6-phosphate isomerase [Burkholderiaceae bacterium]
MTSLSTLWSSLADQSQQVAPMRQLFDADPGRLAKHSLEAAGLVLDASKNRVDDALLANLLVLAEASGVEARRAAMFAGKRINTTEKRAVLHVALRANRDAVYAVDGNNVVPEVQAVLDHMEVFSEQVRRGAWTGHSGKAINDVVHIGIGGSDLGPRFACLALKSFHHDRLSVQFVANVDAHALDDALATLDPATTLFIIASKTFTTAETMMNARSARDWATAGGVPEAELHRHFVAVSTNAKAVVAFGIDVKNMFRFWDWVGGRYSLWSAIGLPIALACGMDRFRALLAGAETMDQHFATTPLAANMPVRLALMGIVNANLLGARSVCIAPYHQHLELLPAHLQQVEMESNGKSVTLEGTPVAHETVPVIWGQPGTNAQHAYFQCLHQGTEWAPIDFIAVVDPTHTHLEHHRALLANCFAQSEALMNGKTTAVAKAELVEGGIDDAEAERLAPHKTFPGNRPSNTIVLQRLDPASLGALIALYEHKVMVQGAIWNIDSFDQWGVELGKVLAKTIVCDLDHYGSGSHDASTAALIERARGMKTA